MPRSIWRVSLASPPVKPSSRFGEAMARKTVPGGFGTVYEGLHLTLGHPVAIKLFRVTDDKSSERRAALLAGFVEEARLLTRLRHAHWRPSTI